MQSKYWKPSLTTQFSVCPVPFRMDTYRGCSYDCRYCFARDFITFSRRNQTGKDKLFTTLVHNEPKKFAKWVERTLAKEYDYDKGEEVAFKERIPLKIGSTADPFPPSEKHDRITYEYLQTLNKYDYPVQLQTKNPEVFLSYAKDFIGANIILSVTLISTDEEFIRVCEPSAPTPKNRLKAIKELTDMGFNVLIKCQPAIYPKILNDIESLVISAKEAGAWGLITEGLKIRVTMPQKEKEIFGVIGEHLGLDIFDYYKKNGCLVGSDYILKDDKRIEVAQKALCLCNTHGLKYFCADNNINIGEGYECCGTEKLRGHKIFGLSCRGKYFKTKSSISTEINKVNVNFCRSTKYLGKTIGECINCINVENNKIEIDDDVKHSFGL